MSLRGGEVGTTSVPEQHSMPGVKRQKEGCQKEVKQAAYKARSVG